MMSPWTLRIRELRQLGLSYADISSATGLAISSIGDLASGQSKCPRGDAAVLLDSLHRRTVAREGAETSVPPLPGLGRLPVGKRKKRRDMARPQARCSARSRPPGSEQ